MTGERVDDGPEQQPDRIEGGFSEPAKGGLPQAPIGRIDLPLDLTEAQLDGRACVRCSAEGQSMRPVEAWSELSSQLFECVDVEACADRRGLCYVCGHEWRWHTRVGMCQGTANGSSATVS